jgi:hypothetical protein
MTKSPDEIADTMIARHGIVHERRMTDGYFPKRCFGTQSLYAS